MSRREPELLLEDIIDSIQKIKNYTNGISSKEFFEDDKTLDAVIRNFEIIGEAANRMPEEIRDIDVYVKEDSSTAQRAELIKEWYKGDTIRVCAQMGRYTQCKSQPSKSAHHENQMGVLQRR
jgi:uncharacterized protein with HEPN domain